MVYVCSSGKGVLNAFLFSLLTVFYDFLSNLPELTRGQLRRQLLAETQNCKVLIVESCSRDGKSGQFPGGLSE